MRPPDAAPARRLRAAVEAECDHARHRQRAPRPRRRADAAAGDGHQDRRERDRGLGQERYPGGVGEEEGDVTRALRDEVPERELAGGAPKRRVVGVFGCRSIRRAIDRGLVPSGSGGDGSSVLPRLLRDHGDETQRGEDAPHGADDAGGGRAGHAVHVLERDGEGSVRRGDEDEQRAAVPHARLGRGGGVAVRGIVGDAGDGVPDRARNSRGRRGDRRPGADEDAIVTTEPRGGGGHASGAAGGERDRSRGAAARVGSPARRGARAERGRGGARGRSRGGAGREARRDAAGRGERAGGHLNETRAARGENLGRAGARGERPSANDRGEGARGGTDEPASSRGVRAACACARRGVRRGPGTRRRARGAHALAKPIRAERVAQARSRRSHAKGREARRGAIGFAPSAVKAPGQTPKSAHIRGRSATRSITVL